MRKSTFLGLFLLASGSVFALADVRSKERDDAFSVFWGKFKTAVISRDKKTVARLTKFPIGVAAGVPSIQNSAELNRRFGEVFNQQTNAAQCFATREPSQDTENADRFAISCPHKDDNFVAYEFERTEQGWKFINRQFPTKCGCR